eukprot:TRINITY_DN2674_c0_g1_i2.p1 TRINITY_DN2674_c0_g1~~TRINITY_DN2674_c0_g1_i2.p1  ORF type:complete len:387 (+),score=99.53 TRINITY_DN2674_c0_g1_i2:97-1257(+)
MMKILSCAAAASLALQVAEGVHLETANNNALAAATAAAAAYETYRAEYGRTEAKGSASYEKRLANFVRAKAAAEAHNAKTGISWKAAVNKFSDYDHAEFKAMLGYRRIGGARFASSKSFLQTDDRKKYNIPGAVNWQNLTSASFVRDQGSCGSCWAVASAGAIETRMEIRNGVAPDQLSFKQLVDCTPNPRNCGGSGGCQGATAELALQYAQEHGLQTESAYGGNKDSTEACRASSVSFMENANLAKPSGFVTLPVNKQAPLMHALANSGPVAVSVAAGDWSSYSSGVFNDCGKDAEIDHAVLAMGYGRDHETGMDYYLIRNSWGSSWGESGGYIRLQRLKDDEGDAGHCGTDHNPKAGVGCDGGPPTLPVCGMCGVLSDSAHPEI